MQRILPFLLYAINYLMRKNGFRRYLIFMFSTLPYFLFIDGILRKIESTKGMPMNTIQGTSVMVKMNVLPYSGKEAIGCPNRKRNNVIEG